MLRRRRLSFCSQLALLDRTSISGTQPLLASASKLGPLHRKERASLVSFQSSPSVAVCFPMDMEHQ